MTREEQQLLLVKMAFNPLRILRPLARAGRAATPVRDAALRGVQQVGGTARKALRTAAKVPEGTPYFNHWRHFVTRPLRTAISPNLGTWGNRARLGGVIGLGGLGVSRGWAGLNQASGTVRDYVEDKPEWMKLMAEPYTTPTGMAWNIGRGLFPGARPDQQVAAREMVNRFLPETLRNRPLWSGQNVSSYITPFKEIGLNSLARFVGNHPLHLSSPTDQIKGMGGALTPTPPIHGTGSRPATEPPALP